MYFYNFPLPEEKLLAITQWVINCLLINWTRIIGQLKLVRVPRLPLPEWAAEPSCSLLRNFINFHPQKREFEDEFNRLIAGRSVGQTKRNRKSFSIIIENTSHHYHLAIREECRKFHWKNIIGIKWAIRILIIPPQSGRYLDNEMANYWSGDCKRARTVLQKEDFHKIALNKDRIWTVIDCIHKIGRLCQIICFIFESQFWEILHWTSLFYEGVSLT